MKLTSLLTGAFLALAAPLSAATVGYTEGSRALVDGTTRISDAAASGLNLGTIGYGAGEFSQIVLSGRLVGHADFFTFTAASDFMVSFAFDGISVGGNEIESGFVRERRGHNEADFVLRPQGDPAGTQTRRLRTDISDPSDYGTTPTIFRARGGQTYSFGVDSRVAREKGAATYDIRISVVPLPAGVLFLMTGLAGLGVLARRKS
ncbi:VPLPA-CTERM sorting domain-containing protein [uncultured Roseobacter sp.]|uniref:VPLPA-CTERM sorting domain-containing protein n=1 Tax=uncultured Roseobacter sp. TaxID=114847 RepID=UPI00260C95BA|nr:VPLPA-CTERM sorting domain-containing protein [uncultured Roseobacter sp.]